MTMNLNAINPHAPVTHEPTPPVSAFAAAAEAPVDVLVTSAAKSYKPSEKTFADAQRDLAALANDVATQWLLPHRRHFVWPRRCKHIMRRMMRAGCGAGESTFPPNYKAKLAIPMVDDSPGLTRYALALSMWHKGLIALTGSIQGASGCGPADFVPVLTAVADDTELSVRTYENTLSAADKQMLRAGAAKLRKIAELWRAFDAHYAPRVAPSQPSTTSSILGSSSSESLSRFEMQPPTDATSARSGTASAHDSCISIASVVSSHSWTSSSVS